MCKPVVVIVRSDLLLAASVSLHSPDLHHPGTFRIKINVLAVGRIIGAVIQSWRTRQSFFFASCCRDRVNIKLTIPFAAESQCLSVRRPAMPVGWTDGSDLTRNSSVDW